MTSIFKWSIFVIGLGGNEMKHLRHIIEESINLELDTYNVYILFAEEFKKDAHFWQTLADEELNHVSILRKSLAFYHQDSKALDQFSVPDIEIVQNCRENVKKMMNDFNNNPTPETAKRIAEQLEQTAVERLYQEFMTKTTDDTVIQLFQELNGEEIDHLNRIRDYFNDK